MDGNGGLRDMATADGDGVISIDYEGRRFHRLTILKDLLGYLLFSYNQIPLPLHQLELSLAAETDLDVGDEVVSNPKEKREKRRKARAAAKEARNLRRLNESIQMLLSSVQAAFDKVEYVPSVLFVLGSSSKRSVAAFEVRFLGEFPYADQKQKCLKTENFTNNLSRKIMRELISRDKSPAFTGPDLKTCINPTSMERNRVLWNRHLFSVFKMQTLALGTYSIAAGTQKLLLFIKTYATSRVPEDFVPKRSYSYRVKKEHEVIIKIKHDLGDSVDELLSVNCSAMKDNMSNEDDIIWFQCKTSVKGVRCCCAIE